MILNVPVSVVQAAGGVILVIGRVVSNVVESLTAVEVLPAASINFTYTVLVPSVVVHHTAE